MSLTVHTAAALVIAHHSHIHIQAFLFALISHVILDLIPHGDYHLSRWFNKGRKKSKMILISEVDVLASTILSAAFFYTYAHDPSIFVWALIGSWLPDIPHIFFHLSNERFMVRLTHWHTNIHFLEKWVKLTVKQSLVLQGLILVVFYLLM